MRGHTAEWCRRYLISEDFVQPDQPALSLGHAFIYKHQKKQYKMAIWFVYLHIWYFLKSGDRCWSFIPQCGLCRLPTWGVYTMCILYIQWNIHSIYSVECCHSSLQYEFLFVVLWSLYHTCHARQLSLANWENAALARSRHTLRLVIADICHLYHLDIKFYAPYVIKNLCKPQLRLYQCSNSSFKLYDDLRFENLEN